MDFQKLLGRAYSENKYVHYAVVVLFLFFVSYPQLYFAYKYFTPSMGFGDYFNYYKMYQHPLDFHATVAPLIYRQISAILTNIAYGSGVHYNTAIVYSANKQDMDIFFAALLVNYLSLLCSAILVGVLVYDELGGDLPIALAGGAAVLLSFYAMGGVMTGMTEGVSWLLFTLIYLCVSRRRWPVATVGLLLLSVIQRETISLAFVAFAGVGYVMETKNRRYFTVLLTASLSCFLLYIAVLKWAPVASGHGYELSAGFLLRNVSNLRSVGGFVLTSIVSQNVIVLILALMLINGKRRAIGVDDYMALAAVAVLAAVGVLAAEGNSTGRIVAIVTPALAVLFARQLSIVSARPGADVASADAPPLHGV